ncbi:hypothetical protein BpHYR1_015659 [Brachionus plicatilis]|uniref:Uncharacterized protein n=1 Tax=Brachionus plicatilis TaxID=10195 RepID=A0A3M7RIT8_BRAPC|nr:hypothetical protein BpHYR1_015659 [Brachionus plicatilis]
MYKFLYLSHFLEYNKKIIDHNFTLTLNTELFFLFQLLTLNSIEDKRNFNPKESNNFRIFVSIESCIFFAIKSISNLEW